MGKRLLFDLEATQPNNSVKRHGGGRYGEIVFQRMLKRGIKFSCFYDSRKWFNPEIEQLCRTANIELLDIAKMPLQEIVDKYKFDRVYSCLPEVYVVYLKRVECYGTLHGLRELELPVDWMMLRYPMPFKERVKRLVKFATHKWYFLPKRKQKYLNGFFNSGMHLLTVSNHSHFSIMSNLPEVKDRQIPVFYSPNTSSGAGVAKSAKTTDNKYFLLVSANRWEKNNLRAVMAFDRLLSAGHLTDMKMRITGMSENKFRYKLQNPSHFEFKGYVSDEELEQLYANAHAFVFPSLNEGFGYPPMEAMRYGVPVISSPFTSISEVCDNAALYFNPYDIGEIMNRMLMICQSEIHARYSTLGLERYEYIRAKQDADLDKMIDFICAD